ncbi:MAG: hypothetical protein GC168_11550 [Candidatus Hydrogenedens sp.]|nr:hypothetical protein [Candidatus Hydrogenedens sp.]
MEDNIVQFPGGHTGSLEAVEQRCLTYLKQSAQPMVPVEKLYRHCARELDPMPLDREGLLAFLRGHGGISVVDGLDPGAAVPPDWFAEAGIDMGPRAAVNERLPSRVEMVRMLAAQVNDLRTALDRAAEQAAGNDARLKTIAAVRARADALLDKLKYMG